MAEIKAVILDLFGTLVDSSKNKKPQAALLKELGLFDEEFKAAYRLASTQEFHDLTSLIRRISPDTKVDAGPYQKQVDYEISESGLFPDALPVLTRLRKMELKICLISNLMTQYKQVYFNLGLGQYFDTAIFSCEVGFRKPEKDIYRISLERLGLSPAEAIMFGDDLESDVMGPLSVGMNAVHLDRGGRSPGSIKTLDEMFQYI